jgi:hypothetical protein
MVGLWSSFRVMVEGRGFRVMVEGSGCRVCLRGNRSFGFQVYGKGLRVWGLPERFSIFRFSSSWSRVEGVGFA